MRKPLHPIPYGLAVPRPTSRHPPVTENIRTQLVAVGVKPYEHRKAALFQLASDMPAPVLAELLAITTKNAAAWAKLAARDWTDYVTERGRSMPHRRRS